jgi:hypothetical protein
VDCSGGDVTKARVPEEALNQVREPLQPVQDSQRLGFKKRFASVLRLRFIAEVL